MYSMMDSSQFQDFLPVEPKTTNVTFIVKLGSRSKVYLKSLIRDLDLELVAIIAMSPTTTTTMKLF